LARASLSLPSQCNIYTALQIQYHNVLADEIHDVGTNPSEWRESSRPTNARDNPLPEAKDEWGDVWGIHVIAHYTPM